MLRPRARMALAVIAGALVLCLVHSAEDQFFKEKCPENQPPTTPTLDQKWFKSIRTWYFNPVSKLQLFRTAAEVQNKTIEELWEVDVYFDACVAVRKPEDGPPSYTSMGKVGYVTATPTGPPLNGKTFELQHLKLKATKTIPITDNKTYVGIITCYDDGTTSWAMMGTTPELDDEEIKKFIEYGESLGFNKENLVNVRYQYCKLD